MLEVLRVLTPRRPSDRLGEIAGSAGVAPNLAGVIHLMRQVVASRIMRTTIDLDPTVVKELKRLSKGAGKSMGRLASELLATSLREQETRPGETAGLEWIAKDLGRPLVDLEDKEAVRAALDRPR